MHACYCYCIEFFCCVFFNVVIKTMEGGVGEATIRGNVVVVTAQGVLGTKTHYPFLLRVWILYPTYEYWY